MRMTEQVRALMQDADPALSVVGDAGRKQADLDQILGSRPLTFMPTRSRRKRLARRVGVSVAVLAAAGGTAAVAVIALKPAPPAPATEIECATAFSSSLAPDVFIIDIGDAASPEEACRAQWPTAMEQRAKNGTPAASVPAHLVACTSDGGNHLTTIVYPRPADMTNVQACAALGLVRPPNGPIYAGATLAQVRELQHGIDTRLAAAGRSGPHGRSAGRCAPYATVQAAAQHSLRELHIDGWRIDDQRRSRNDTGVWFYLDPEAGTVVLTDPRYCSAPTP